MVVYYSIRMIVVRRVNYGLGRLRTIIVDLAGSLAMERGTLDEGASEASKRRISIDPSNKGYLKLYLIFKH